MNQRRRGGELEGEKKGGRGEETESEKGELRREEKLGKQKRVLRGRAREGGC